jgi:hypothetical protein
LHPESELLVILCFHLVAFTWNQPIVTGSMCICIFDWNFASHSRDLFLRCLVDGVRVRTGDQIDYVGRCARTPLCFIVDLGKFDLLVPALHHH